MAIGFRFFTQPRFFSQPTETLFCQSTNPGPQETGEAKGKAVFYCRTSIVGLDFAPTEPLSTLPQHPPSAPSLSTQDFAMPPAPPLRLVSLLPSATEILDCLGLTDRIVGRSHECDYPAAVTDRPICTAARLDSRQPSGQIDADVHTLLNHALGLYAVNLDQLQTLQPTHIVTQDQCDVCAVTLAAVETAVANLAPCQPQVISLQPNCLGDLWADLQRVGVALGVEAGPIVAALQDRVAACHQKTVGLEPDQRPTVVAIEWIDPLMGSGNWIPELVTLAGGQNQLGQMGQHSPYISWETLLDTNPDVLVVMPCGFDLERTRQEMHQAMAQDSRWQQLGSVQGDRLYLTDGNAYFNRPGPRLVDSLEILGEMLHPTLYPRRYPPTAWEQFRGT